jgi:hypothetical protein
MLASIIYGTPEKKGRKHEDVDNEPVFSIDAEIL